MAQSEILFWSCGREKHQKGGPVPEIYVDPDRNRTLIWIKREFNLYQLVVI